MNASIAKNLRYQFTALCARYRLQPENHAWRRLKKIYNSVPRPLRHQFRVEEAVKYAK